MNEYGVPPVLIRFYRENDGEQIVTFRCSPYSPKWKRAPERIIQRAPSTLHDEGIEILVAEDETRIVGVAVFEVSDKPSCYVWSIGVTIERQNEGIGKSLKQAVMVVAADRHPGLGVESEVHRLNEYMLRINRRLLAETEVSRGSNDYLLTFVKAIVVPESGGVTVSRHDDGAT